MDYFGTIVTCLLNYASSDAQLIVSYLFTVLYTMLFFTNFEFKAGVA